MATEIKMPQLGLTMEEGTVERWLKAEGDAVKAGEPLLEITTDKLTNEVEAETDGVLVFVDLLGGTPFNQAMMISQDISDVEVVTGANLPMLIELLLTRGAGSTLAELADQAVTVGQTGIVHRRLEPTVADDELDDEDGI